MALHLVYVLYHVQQAHLRGETGFDHTLGPGKMGHYELQSVLLGTPTVSIVIKLD